MSGVPGMWNSAERGKHPGGRPVALDRGICLLAARYRLWDKNCESFWDAKRQSWDPYERRYHVDEYKLLAAEFGYRNARQAREAFHKYRRLIGCRMEGPR